MPVLAAGDYNEARNWDQHHPGAWGEEYFQLACDAGLHDLTYTVWGEERDTCGGYQVDHVLATADVAARVTDAELGPPSGSDHATVVVRLTDAHRPAGIHAGPSVST